MIDRLVPPIHKGLLVLGLSLACSQSFAGNRGYLVVFFDTSETGEAKRLFQSYRSSHDQRTISHCWADRRGEWISSAYVNRVPKWFSGENAGAIVRNDPNVIAEMAAKLSLYRDDLVVSGFDGAFVAARMGGGWRLIGLSRDGLIRSSEIKERLDPAALDKALCEAASAFDTAFVP